MQKLPELKQKLGKPENKLSSFLHDSHYEVFCEIFCVELYF